MTSASILDDPVIVSLTTSIASTIGKDVENTYREQTATWYMRKLSTAQLPFEELHLFIVANRQDVERFAEFLLTDPSIGGATGDIAVGSGIFYGLLWYLVTRPNDSELRAFVKNDRIPRGAKYVKDLLRLRNAVLRKDSTFGSGNVFGPAEETSRLDLAKSQKKSQLILEFKYHPDPIATGSIAARETTCDACSKPSALVYVGPQFGESDNKYSICPNCIASGEAHTKLGVSFHDIESIPGNLPECCDVDDSVREEIAYRTPGFSGWQQESWYTCCDDAAAFLGRFDGAAIRQMSEEDHETLEAKLSASPEDWNQQLDYLSLENGPTAFLFRCLHCHTIGGYVDSL